MQKSKLPIGIQSFEKIRTGDYYYVDKTRHIAQLIDHGSYYFLSRPRRFGKSLLLDTIKNYSKAIKHYFQDYLLKTNGIGRKNIR